MSILGNDLLLAGTDEGYNLTRSLRLRSSASAYLSRTPAGAGNRQIFTYSAWIKRGTLGVRQGIIVCTDAPANNYFDIEFLAADQLDIQGSNGTWRLTTSAVYRDPSAWYHIVLAVDTTQATTSNRVKLYVNGSQISAFSTASYPTLNSNCYFNLNAAHSIGSWQPASGLYLDGYLTEVNFIDGQALTPSSFGETDTITGVWKPKRYAGTYGTNGFYLPFTDNSALTTSSNVGLGKDFSGNGNYWTTNNISITAGTTYDSMTDVPTLTSATAANFAVLNPIIYYPFSTTIADGNLKMTGNNAGSHSISTATIAMPNTGKWYAEFTLTAVGGSFPLVGLIDANTAPSSASYLGALATTYSYAQNGTKYTGAAPTAYGASYTNGDVIAIAFDATAGTLTFYKNNTSQGVAFSSLTSTYFMAVDAFNGGGWNANFGQRPFTYTPPTGYVALNTYNLPNSTIVKGNTVMDATLWTGNGTSQTITNAAGFKPDFVWIKNRNNVRYHILTDSVRGTNSQLFSNDTLAQETRTDRLTAFNSNGFSVGSYTDVNLNADTFVGWQWQAGQGTTSSNTNGTITSTVSVNASAGFSVVTYTGTNVSGATIGHGLGVAPRLIIIKNRSSVEAWPVYHSSVGATKYLVLNTTAAEATASTPWNNTAPTSTVFSLGNWNALNENGSNHVAYCFAPIAGYSAFGSFSGNGSTDGTFIYTGFLPRFVMIKRTSSADDWRILDTARNTYNVMNLELYPNAASAETTVTDFDVVSNGIKLRNLFSGTYIYAAFATTPFKNSLAR